MEISLNRSGASRLASNTEKAEAAINVKILSIMFINN
jgi:hypothetical protein